MFMDSFDKDMEKMRKRTCDKIVLVAKEIGYEITTSQARIFWQKESNQGYAGWLFLPPDERLKKIIKEYYEQKTCPKCDHIKDVKMYDTYFFVTPLKVNKSKNKYFMLNLNNYRNAYYQTLNITKKDFCRVMNNRYPQPIKAIPGQVKTIYTVYAGTRRAFDLPNVCSIVQKYFEDWLVSRGVLADDNIKTIIECAYKYGGVDKDAPRVEVQIIT